MRWLLSIALLGVVAGRLSQDWSSFDASALRTRPGWIALAFTLLGAHIVVAVEMWRLLMRFLGHPVESRLAFHILGVSNLAKYLPGGIWNFVGRAVMCQRHGIPTALVLEGLVVELAVQAGANGLIAVATLTLVDGVVAQTLPAWAGWIALLPVLGLHPVLLNHCAALAERLFRRALPRIHLSYTQLLAVYALSIGNWCLLGVAFGALGQGISGSDLSEHNALWLVGAANAAWLFGSIAFFIPGGLGVREVALTSLLGASFGIGWPALLSLVSRMWISAAELLWFLVANSLSPLSPTLAASSSTERPPQRT